MSVSDITAHSAHTGSKTPMKLVTFEPEMNFSSRSPGRKESKRKMCHLIITSHTNDTFDNFWFFFLVLRFDFIHHRRPSISSQPSRRESHQRVMREIMSFVSPYELLLRLAERLAFINQINWFLCLPFAFPTRLMPINGPRVFVKTIECTSVD